MYCVYSRSVFLNIFTYVLLLCHRALVAFITYFVVGAVFLRVKHQKTGTDLIIHKEFWKDFPFLIKVKYVLLRVL